MTDINPSNTPSSAPRLDYKEKSAGVVVRSLDLFIKLGEAAKSLVNLAKLALIILLCWLLYSFSAPILKMGSRLTGSFDTIETTIESTAEKASDIKESIGHKKDSMVNSLSSAKDKLFSFGGSDESASAAALNSELVQSDPEQHNKIDNEESLEEDGRIMSFIKKLDPRQ